MRRRALLAAGAVLPLAARATAEPIAPGDRLQWPALRLLDGGALDPLSWQGQATVLVFWATWCPHCLRHNAHVDKLHRTLQGQGLRVLGVALEDDAGKVRRYMASHGYAFPVALDGDVLRRRLTARRVLPMTVVLDRQGRLRQTIPGEMTEDDVLDLPRIAQRPST